MKRNADYWAERFKLIEQAEHNRGAAAVSDIEKQYREAQRQLEAKLDAWYRRFADNNQVSMTEAKKMLAGRDLKEFKWDVHEYIRYGEENALNGQWVKELENASARVHISRLEAMKIQMQQQVEVLFGGQLDSIDSAMRDIYLDGYYRTAYEVHKGVGFGWDFGTLDQRRIDKIINKPWAQDGRNFSDRVWSNKQKLVGELNTTLTQNIVLGQDPQKAIDAMSKRLNVSKNTAGRLVMTEQAAFCSAAQHDCFKDLDVEEYEIVATLDSHTSEICQEMDGKHFKMSEWETGTTAPPFHVWCRSTTVPYFEDDFGEPGERAARGADGKTYMVPANTTYKEWSKAFVDGDKSGLQQVPDSGTVKAASAPKPQAEELKVDSFPDALKTSKETANTQSLVDFVNSRNDADPNVVALFNQMGKLETVESNGITFEISHGSNHAVTQYTRVWDGSLTKVKLTIPKLQGNNLVGQVNTTLHEEMHLMDLYGRTDVKQADGWFSTSRQPLVDVFKNTSDSMSADVQKLFADHRTQWNATRNAISQKYYKLTQDLRNQYFPAGTSVFSDPAKYKKYQREAKKLQSAMNAEIDYECRNLMGGGIGNLEDIYDALSGGKFRDNGTVLYGHGSKYYRSREGRVHETIANYAALSITRPDLIDLLRADKPDLVKELDETIVELLKKAKGTI